LRRAIARKPERRHMLRSARLTAAGILATAILAVGLPLLADTLGVVRIEGLPLGYYVAAQGGLFGLVILAFVWAARQARIDREEGNG
jgi:putative solute:sodium symporter small subunit